MTNPERYRVRKIKYGALTEDDRNVVVAELEGWGYDAKDAAIEGISLCWYLTEPRYTPTRPMLSKYKVIRILCKPPDYLHDKALCFDLIEKYEIDVEHYSVGLNVSCSTSDYNIEEYESTVNSKGPVQSRGEALQAAIVHAVCEIAREQDQEAVGE